MDVSDWIKKYCRLTDYLTVAQLYLKDNFLLEKTLSKSHLKARIIGHWGTCPGLNYIYASLNATIVKEKKEFLLVVGPGHGYPAIQANLFLEGSLGEVNPALKINKKGFGHLIKQFSWPHGFPSHLNPETPGAILEGGELGYCLSTSYGSVLDNPNLITVCVVGDGEAETGPLAAAWQSNKFINPKTDGVVLPIVHINGYKISNPTLFGSMSRDEITFYFKGLNYDPIFVEPEDKDESLYNALHSALVQIKQIKKTYSEGDKPQWPVILLKTPKGWGGIESFKKVPIANSYKSHGIPINPKHGVEELKAVRDWLKSYKVNELVSKTGKIKSELLEFIPTGKKRMGMNKHANGGKLSKPLTLPDPKKYAVCKRKTKCLSSSLKQSGIYLRDVIAKNDNFRLFCPDEIESNFLGAVFEKTKRQFIWPIDKKVNKNTAVQGQVMEILSEHTLQGWISGYILTGRHGLFSSYEAFIGIIESMSDQFVKFLKQSQKVAWRKEVPSMNYLLTSLGWRQDHNGFSHQNPSFISALMNKYNDFTKIYFPANADMMLVYLRKVLGSTGGINVIVAGKRDIVQFLSYKETLAQVEKGGMIWDVTGYTGQNPDIILSSAGDYCTEEMLAAIKILNKDCKEMKIRFVNVSDLDFLISCCKTGTCTYNVNLEDYYTAGKDVIFNFHGYPEVIKSLICNHELSERMHIHGYCEEGTTTTPFDMQVRNETSRFHIAMRALELASKQNKSVAAKKDKLVAKYKKELIDHHKYICEHGKDMPSIVKWCDL